jgi:hypothetical protein
MTGLRMAEGVAWTVESTGVLVLSTQHQARLLTDLEAAAWDLIARGDSPGQAAAKLATIGGIGSQEAGSALHFWLREWTAVGWLEEAGDG